MKTICTVLRSICAVLALGTLFMSANAEASVGDFQQAHAPVRVIARLPLSGGATQVLLRQQDGKQYLYVQRPAQQGFTVINVTNPGRPKLVPHVSLETRTVVGSGLMITETSNNSAAAGAAPEGESARVPESVHVLEVSGSGVPRTTATFDGTTGILRDPARNLIYLVDANGVWILSQKQVVRGHKCGSSDAISSIPDCN